MQAGKFNVLVVSPNERFKRVLPLLLSRHEALNLRGCVNTPLEALHHPQADQMDVILSDLPPGKSDDILTWRAIRDIGPRILMLTRYLERRIEMSSVLAGASGLFLVPELRLADVVAQIASGDTMRSQELLGHLQSLISGEAPTPLDNEERKVLELVCEGEQDAQIASQLGTTPLAVQEHIIVIAQKLI